LIEKANYIHQNPVRAGLVERAEDYRWSSIRCWQRGPLEDEPLLVDIDQINWHKGWGEASKRWVSSERQSLSARKAAKPRTPRFLIPIFSPYFRRSGLVY